MKVILFMAVSLNGLIAREDGREDFLLNENLIDSVGIAKQTGCLIWGRKTYEAVKGWEGSYLEDLKSVNKIIISKNSNLVLDEGFILANSPEDALQKATGLGLTEVMLTGGGNINSSFAKAGLIDEIILNVNPFILGRGVRLFSDADFEFDLELLKVDKLTKDIVQVHYKIKK